MKRSELKRKSAKSRRRRVPTFARVDWDEATMLLWQRCRGRCEHCGRELNGRMERHHRQRRRDGGDRLSNLIALLPECHAEVHMHPQLSREHGWIVSAFTSDPASVPLQQWGSQLVLLDDEGHAYAHH